jgi:hypothetical protein
MTISMSRGEVGIVVAQIGLSLGVIDVRLYAVILFRRSPPR